MDYDYFPHYEKNQERMRAQDAIVRGLVVRKRSPVERETVPWLTYLCGAYGSGKSHSVRHLWAGYLAVGAVYIDPDVIKGQLPTGSADLHREATFVALLAERAAIARRLSAVIDGSLYDHVWYGEYLDTLRAHHPDYRLAMVKVDCKPIDMVLERCKSRAACTGRSIAEAKLRDIFAKIPIAFERLRPRFDCVVIIENSITPHIAEIHAQRDPGQPWPTLAPFLLTPI